MRALIDWWVERMGDAGAPAAPSGAEPAGQDIPID